jgi:hypothetical protein
VTTVLLILHGLLAVALLGAITHQAVSLVRAPADRGSMTRRFRGVAAAGYTTSIVPLFVVTALAGAVLYPEYRTLVRPILEAADLRAANGAFEIKEQLAALGLGMLPAYWALWRSPAPEHLAARRGVTWFLTFVVWSNFLIGHVVNNVQGLFQ